MDPGDGAILGDGGGGGDKEGGRAALHPRQQPLTLPRPARASLGLPGPPSASLGLPGPPQAWYLLIILETNRGF